jgi:hypothetical protein
MTAAAHNGSGAEGHRPLDTLARAHRILVEFETVVLSVEDELGRQALASGASLAEIARALDTSECEVVRRLRDP